MSFFTTLLYWLDSLITILVPLIGAIGLLVAYEIYNSILTHPTGSAKAREIQQEFQDGLKLFLKIENRNFFYFVVVFLIGILIFNHNGFWTSFTFCLGVLLSALSSRLGLLSASEANIRAANAAREKGQGDALFLAFGGGSIMGLAIANFSLIGIGVLFYFFNSTENISNLCGFALGANIFALYVRFCGGNLLNAAETSFDNINDLSTDLAEDDLRNPVFIVKKIANQIANIAASATDFFDSNVTAIIASMIIASFLSKENLGDLTSISADSSAEDTLRFNFILMSVPLILSTLGLISSLIGIKLIKNFKDEDPIKAFKVATWISTFLYVFFSLLMFVFFIPVKFSIWWTVLIGAFCSVLIPKITEYFTTSRPIGKVINASFTSAQRSILSAISVGLNNAWTILIVLAFALLLADYFAGIYGVSIAAISMLATVGITISIDTYCPIINDAKVIAKMSDYNPEAHEIIEHLHKLGQNTLLMRKDLAISSAFMTAIVVFMAFAISANISPISFYEPYLIFGLIIGVCFPTLLSSLSVNSINRISTKILEEAKKQFKEYQVLDKSADSVSTDSKAVITVSALAVIRAIVVPVICLITIPLLIYSMFGKEALAGMCLGTFITGTILSLFIVNTAEVWSSANNFFQSDKLVVKDYDESLDTSLFLSNSVGNYLKDSSGLLMSLLIKFIAIYALILSFSF